VLRRGLGSTIGEVEGVGARRRREGGREGRAGGRRRRSADGD